jgi:hypothetical protein
MAGLFGCIEACLFLLFSPAFAFTLSSSFSLGLEARTTATSDLKVFFIYINRRERKASS